MPKVQIDGNSKYDANETFSRVCEILKSDDQIKSIDPNISFDLNQDKLCGSANGKQFKAEFNVTAKNEGADVSFTVDLPFILSPIKGKVKSIIEQKIEKALS